MPEASLITVLQLPPPDPLPTPPARPPVYALKIVFLRRAQAANVPRRILLTSDRLGGACSTRATRGLQA